MNTKKGFTLVELLVVIAILAILATVSVVGYTSFIGRAEQSNADTEAHQIKTMITSALVIPGDSVQIKTYADENDTTGTTVYLVKDGTAIKRTETRPTTGKIQDLTGEVDGLGGKLSFNGNKLVYTAANGKTSDVLNDVAAVVVTP